MTLLLKVAVVETLPEQIKNRIALPQYATDGSACFDLCSIEHGELSDEHTKEVFRTGLKFEVPSGFVMLIYSRSGHGFKNNVRLANCVGVIDSDYRGEVMVKLTKDPGDADFAVMPGDRIAQAMLVQVPTVKLQMVKQLSDTVRGEGGFGSTGRNFIGMTKES